LTEAPVIPLEKNVQYLMDRQAILDCINRYTRGLDRHDEPMIASAYHEDGVDNHGPRVASIPDFVRWVNDAHAGSFSAHTHHITCHTCEIEGDVAHTESYVLFVQRTKDGNTLQGGSGRYIDRLEKRNGVWKIALRRLVIDWRFKAEDVTWEGPKSFPAGTWDQGDLSYRRPLTTDPAP
jgi:hypothetical protein